MLQASLNLFLPALLSTLLLTAQPVQAADPLPESWKIYEERYPLITIEKLKAAMERHEVTLIDANRSDTYQKGHIPGAISFSELSAGNSTGHLPRSRKQLVVVYCGGSQCTAWHRAADFASVKGYKQIKHYKGGLKEWKERGNTIETSQ